jgi:hypothetical protein
MQTENLNKLPVKLAKIWDSTYQSNKTKYGPERASIIAWSAIKDIKEEQPVERTITVDTELTLTSESLVCRSEKVNESSNDYFIEGYIATKNPTPEDGLIFTQELLNQLEQEIKDYPINIKGDLEHVNSRMRLGRKVEDNLPTYDDFVKIVDTKLDNYGLWVRAKLDKYADNFPILWSRINDGFYDAFSIEVILDKNEMRDKFVDGRLFKEAYKGRINKFSLTGKPKDKYSKVTAAYIK